MADRADLEAAAAAGVISAEQVQPLHTFLAGRRATPATPARPTISGEEDLRFIRNFHDVFLAIGILLFSIGLAIGIGTYVATSAADPTNAAVLGGALCLGAAALLWGLGELFARRRRLFLPAIAIVLAFTAFTVVAAGALYTGVLLERGFEANLSDLRSIPPEIRAGIMVAAAFMILAPLGFYARFRLPFSLGAAGAGFAVFVIVSALLANLEAAVNYLSALYLALGVLLFLAGVAFDARDPERATRFSDNGFWLHFAAAPLILNGALGLVSQALTGSASFGQVGMMVSADNAAPLAVATLIVVALLGVVSLLINRRALIVSALITTGVAIGILMNAAGLGAGALAASTLIVLGAFVLILGAGWHAVRRALLGWVRPDGLWARVFPPESPATA